MVSMLLLWLVSPPVASVLMLIGALPYQSRHSTLTLPLLQVEDAGFSLNHPNQYFVESQRLLTGGRELKREAEAPQRGQAPPAGKAASALPEHPSTSTEIAEDLDSLFQED